MAEANFTIHNQHSALSPMVLRARTQPGATLTMTLSVGIYPTESDTVRVMLTADLDGEVVHDVSPLVRDILRRRFTRGNIRTDDDVTMGYPSPYGDYITVRLDGTYAVMDKALWANRSAELAGRIATGKDIFLLPTGIYNYYKGGPGGLFSIYGNDRDDALRARNKSTGAVTVLTTEYHIFDDVANYSDGIFSPLSAGEYTVYGNSPDDPYMDLTVHGCFPTEAVRSGDMAYVRYCNRWGGISLALLKVASRSQKSKCDYVRHQYALDGSEEPSVYAVAPDRTMTGNEVTRTFKAGRDQMTRDEIKELQSILVSPMVDRYDADTGEWVPVYPADSTVTETGEALQEMTIEFEENTEGF